MKMLISSALVCFSTLAGAACDIDNPFVGCFEYDPKQVKSIPKTTVEPVKQTPINTSRVTDARHDSCPSDRRIYVGNAGQFLCRHEDAELKRAAADVAAMYANGGESARTLGLVEAGLREGASRDYVVTTETGESYTTESKSSSYFEIDFNDTNKNIDRMRKYQTDVLSHDKNSIGRNAVYILQNEEFLDVLVGQKAAACSETMSLLLSSGLTFNGLVDKRKDIGLFGLGSIKMVQGINGQNALSESAAAKSINPIAMSRFMTNEVDINTARKVGDDLIAANKAFREMDFLKKLLVCSDAIQQTTGKKLTLVNK